MGADAAGAAMDEQQLTGPQAGGHHQVRPHRAGDLRQTRGVRWVHSGWNRQDLGRRHGDELRVTTACQQSAAGLPCAPLCDAVAERFDRPGHLQPDDVAGPGRRRILARGLEEVGAVDPGRGDANEDLTRSGCHVGNGLPGESFGRLGHDREHSQNATTLRERAAGSASCCGHAVLLLDDGGDHWGAYCERYAWIGHC